MRHGSLYTVLPSDKAWWEELADLTPWRIGGLRQGVVTDADATTALLRQMLAIDQSQLRSFFGIDAHARTRVWRMCTKYQSAELRGGAWS
jgi:hypothetical protein